MSQNDKGDWKLLVFALTPLGTSVAIQALEFSSRVAADTAADRIQETINERAQADLNAPGSPYIYDVPSCNIRVVKLY